MRKFTSIMLTTLLVGAFLGLLMHVTPASAVTWDSTLHWDFEDHTDTHENLKKLSAAQISAIEQTVNAAFASHGYAAPNHIAYPFGNYDPTVKQTVALYRKSGRTVSGTSETYPVPDWYALKCAELVKSTTFATLKGWVDACISSKTLLSIFTHDVSARPSKWGCTPAVLTQLLDYLVQQQNAGKLKVMPIAQAYDVWSTATTNPGATVVIMFDDAYESDYTTVYPLFKARGLIGTSYIVTGFIDTSGSLTWTEIAAMRAGSGLRPKQLKGKLAVRQWGLPAM